MSNLMFKSNRRRGAVTVEMAVTAPILFLLVFSALEFCSMNNLIHTIDNAAYEAARRGIVPGATINDVRQEANAILAAVGARNATVDVTPSVITEDTQQILVEISVPIRGNGWIAPVYFANRTNLVGECTLRREEY